MKYLGPSTLIVSCLVFTTSCGSTVPQSTVRHGAHASADESKKNAPDSPSGNAGTISGVTPGQGGRRSGAADTGVANTGEGARAGGGTTRSTNQLSPSPSSQRGETEAPGVTANAISVGINYSPNQNAAITATGRSADTGDQRAYAQATVDYLNSHGGLGGKKIVPVWNPQDYTDGETDANRDQSSCSNFTEDHRVFASVPGALPTLQKCLGDHGILAIGSGTSLADDQDLRQYQNLYLTDTFSVTRMVKAYINSLVSTGFLSRTSRIGLVYYDYPAYRRAVSGSLRPTLAGAGMSLAASAPITPVTDLSTYATGSPQIQNAVLRFNSDHIDRVLVLDAVGILASTMMKYANSQRYRPRYGLNTTSLPGLLPDRVSPTQLDGAVGVGWQPVSDVDAQRDPGATPGTALCSSIMRRAGIAVPGRFALYYALQYCDSLFFLKAAVEGASQLTTTGIRTRVGQLGNSLGGNMAISTFFGPGRRDGANSVRNLIFNSKCNCFSYSGKVTPVE